MPARPIAVGAVAALAAGAGPAAAASSFPAPPRVLIIPAACPTGPPACAYPYQGIVYVAPGSDRFTLEHELGHLFDAELLDDRDRHWFALQLGLPGPWRVGTGLEGLRSPSERFADAYAVCALGLRPDRGPWETAYDYEPTAAQHRAICAAMKQVAARM